MSEIKKHPLLRIRWLVGFVNKLLPYAVLPSWGMVTLLGKLRTIMGRSSKKILLICHNPVAADHLRPIIDLITSHRPDWKLYVANDHFPSQEISKVEIKKNVFAKYIPILIALNKYWDLVIYVNHPWGFGSWLAPCLKKIYINHGLYAGKINNRLGEDGVYGAHRTCRKHRGILFDRMFAASQAERDAAIAANRELASRVVVCGSLMADQLHQLARNKVQLRKSFGIETGSLVVHVISTWGEDSLAATVDEWLTRGFLDDKRGVVVLLSVHPRFDKFGGTKMTRLDILKRWKNLGAVVDVDNRHWKDFVVMSDVAVSDHSSLALYHVMLRHPVGFVPVDDRAFIGGVGFDSIRAVSVKVVDATSIASLVRQLASTEAYQDVIVGDLVNNIGSAAKLHLKEMDTLIQ